MKKYLILALSVLFATAAFAQNTPIYGVKSGILKTVTTTGDQKSYNTQWFDDYGKKDKSLTTMSMGDFGEYSATVLMVGDDCWLINQDGKAKKAEARPVLNWRDLSEKNITDFNITDLGTEEYTGRTCRVFSYEEKQFLTKVKITNWVWEGLVIKQVIKKKLSESVTELEDLKVNVSIPASTFAIPKTED
jgi:hypothetical protein